MEVTSYGGANFGTIQQAIDSVPENNYNWICIHISKGVYREKIVIPSIKPFIYLKGEGMQITSVVWDSHETINTSATFNSYANNIIVSGISFVNSYNSPGTNNPMTQAPAVLVQGDQLLFYQCGFYSLQDTLWDAEGRHYFIECTIEGAVDFIFGAGQSIYERCTISVIAQVLGGSPGYITAQGRLGPNDPDGFIFKGCNIVGNGKTYLGRPWRDYARVIFYQTTMSDVIVPEGWDPWDVVGREYHLTFCEYKCMGPGEHKRRRVKWSNQLDNQLLKRMIYKTVFIDVEGWITKALNLLFNS